MGWIDYDIMNKRLIFKNKGKIPAFCILLGGSTKQNDLNLIGTFGEGFKIAALVLLRGFNRESEFWIESQKKIKVPENVKNWEPKKVHIMNDNEKWTFYMDKDPKFFDQTQ
jgi:hypothetical protein